MTTEEIAINQDLALPARYYLRVLDQLRTKNIEPEQLLGPLGLSLAELAEADATLSLIQVDRLLNNAVSLCACSDLGFELGKGLKLTSHSMVGFGILSSPTVDYALRLAARYFSLIMPSFRMRFGLSGDIAVLEYQPLAPMSPTCLDFHLEAIAIATHYESRDLLQGDMPRYDLLLSIDKPAHHHRYDEITEARCQFRALKSPGIRMQFPASVASRPLAFADNAALRMAESRCRSLVSKVVSKRRVAGWIEMMLRESSDGMPNLEELARTLNLSTRTLDRHLQREGAGFRQLRNRVQLDKARELLAEDALSITQIAHELGYTDAANFSRAFRREAGISPRAWREQSR